ncbi:hypothetical protein ERHA54_18900 [Erwinia rhapontici]|nr:hypothetical protein ERHA54_18900 [Erwinia rhapontici]
MLIFQKWGEEGAGGGEEKAGECDRCNGVRV